MPSQKGDTLPKDEKEDRKESGDEDDEAPPQLVPEEGPYPEEIMQMERMEKGSVC